MPIDHFKCSKATDLYFASTSPPAAVYLRHGTPNVSQSSAAFLADYGHSALPSQPALSLIYRRMLLVEEGHSVNHHPPICPVQRLLKDTYGAPTQVDVWLKRCCTSSAVRQLIRPQKQFSELEYFFSSSKIVQ